MTSHNLFFARKADSLVCKYLFLSIGGVVVKVCARRTLFTTNGRMEIFEIRTSLAYCAGAFLFSLCQKSRHCTLMEFTIYLCRYVRRTPLRAPTTQKLVAHSTCAPCVVRRTTQTRESCISPIGPCWRLCRWRASALAPFHG